MAEACYRRIRNMIGYGGRGCHIMALTIVRQGLAGDPG